MSLYSEAVRVLTTAGQIITLWHLNQLPFGLTTSVEYSSMLGALIRFPWTYTEPTKCLQTQEEFLLTLCFTSPCTCLCGGPYLLEHNNLFIGVSSLSPVSLLKKRTVWYLSLYNLQYMAWHVHTRPCMIHKLLCGMNEWIIKIKSYWAPPEHLVSPKSKQNLRKPGWAHCRGKSRAEFAKGCVVIRR